MSSSPTSDPHRAIDSTGATTTDPRTGKSHVDRSRVTGRYVSPEEQARNVDEVTRQQASKEAAVACGAACEPRPNLARHLATLETSAGSYTAEKGAKRKATRKEEREQQHRDRVARWHGTLNLTPKRKTEMKRFYDSRFTEIDHSRLYQDDYRNEKEFESPVTPRRVEAKMRRVEKQYPEALVFFTKHKRPEPTDSEQMQSAMVGRSVRCIYPAASGVVLDWQPFGAYGCSDVLIRHPDGSECWYGSGSLLPTDNKGPLPSASKVRSLRQAEMKVSMRRILRRFVQVDFHKPWPGCEFAKAFIGNSILGSMDSLDMDRKAELENATRDSEE